MKKWMFLIAAAFVAVIAIGVYCIAVPESSDYSGSSGTSECTMEIDNGSFVITYTEYQENSYLSTESRYSGQIVADKFVVNSVSIKDCEFGKVYREFSEKDMSVPLGDVIFFREVSAGYIVKDTYIAKNPTSRADLLYVTTEEAMDNAGSDIVLVKGSSKTDIVRMTIAEIYSDGTVKKYPVDPERIGDVNLDRLGKRTVPVGYGDGRTAVLSLEIVPFMIEKNEIMNRGTSFEHAQSIGKLVFDKADGVGDITADGWNSMDGTKRIWLSCGNYSISSLFTFTSDADRTVKEASVSIDHYIGTGSELPVFDIHMVMNNGTVYDIQSDDPQVSITGYDKDASGPQTVRISYMGNQFSIVVYSFNEDNLIPKEAHLINVNKTFDSKDSLLLYTEKGLNYDNYAIRYQMCDGSVRTMPLTPDMVTFSGILDAEGRVSIGATISQIIECYRYIEDVDVRYDATEETIRNSLSIKSIIGDRTSAYYSAMTSEGTYAISFGYRDDDLYIAHDVVTSSFYLSDSVMFTHSGNDAFTLYLQKGHTLDRERSLIGGSELVKYTIDHDDVLYADFSMVMGQDDIGFLTGLGFTAGDMVTFKVTYDGVSGTVTEMDILKGETAVADGEFVYGAGVLLSTEVKKYVDNIGTVTVVMKYDDGRSDGYFSINSGLKDLSFECDDGYGVFMKDGDDMVPFVMPIIGITTSTDLYCLRI